MQDLKQVLLELFGTLDDEIRDIVSEVYSLEQEYSNLHKSHHGINESIKDIIDKHARYQVKGGGNNED